MAKGYIGKISAIVTVNTADAERAFNKSAADAQKFGANLQRTVSQATRDAGKSFDNIFTPLQKLQRAIQASKSANFNLGIKGLSAQDLERVERLTLAARQLAAPLGAASKQFDGLSFAVQRQFSPALERVTTELLQVRDRIQDGGRVGREEFSRLATEIDNVTASTSRLGETATLTKRLLSGGLEFSRPQAFDSINRLVEAQRGLSGLPASTRGSEEVNTLIRDARLAASQVERISARIERLNSEGLNIRVSQAGLDAASRRLEEIRRRTEAIVEESATGSSTDVSARLRNANAIRQAAEEEAAFRSRAADQAEREARALEQLTQSQNQLLRAEIDRRSGASARRNAASFDAATEGVLQAPQRNAEVLIGRRQRTVESVRDEIRQLDQEFQRLPEAARNALQGEAERLNAIAEAARTNGAGLGVLINAYERLSASVREAASEESRRRQAVNDANSRLVVLQDESAALSTRGATGGNQGPPLPPGFGGASDAGIGRSITDPARRLEGLRSSINSVNNQLEQLPASVQQRFIPAITEAEAQFRRLAASPAATVVAIERASAGVQRLAANARQAAAAVDFREQFGTPGAIIGNAQRQQLQGYTAQIQVLQGEIASLSARARGPAVAAIARLGDFIATAMERGTLETRQARREIELLTNDAVRATAAARGISQGALARTVARAGDVGRQGFANFGLAVQQAAFIVDDFFSVTGGLDQRIRAIGNNISQLGFVIGGTAGLVAGVAVSITSQLVVALIKWSNQGVETKDRVDALNDALSRQKRLAEDLAGAFDAVADAIERTGFSQQTKELRERQRLVDDIRKKSQAELRERVAGLDPEVQRERGIQAARERELNAAEDPGERVRLTRAIRASRERERAAADRAVAQPGATPQQAVEAATEARFRVREAEINLAARAAAASSPSAAAQEAIERRRRQDIERARAEADEFRRRNAAVVGGTRDPREQVRRANEVLDQQQKEIEQSITTGIASLFDGANAERRRQLAALEQARAQLEKDIFRAATNEVAIEATKTAIDAASRIGRAQETIAKAIGDGASGTSIALEALNQRLIEAENQLKRAQESGNLVGAEAAQKLINQINQETLARESAARSVAQFADVLKRISTSLAETVAGEARSAADQARRDANSSAAGERSGAERPGDRAFRDRRRERAEQQAREAEDRRDRVRRQNDLRRRLFEQQATAGELGKELQAAIRERDQAQQFLDSGQGTADDRAAAQNRRDRAQARLDRGFEDSASGRAARDAADRADQNAQMARQQEESIQRGRELRETPAQKAANEVGQSLRDLSNAIDEEQQAIIDSSNGLPTAQDRQRLLQLEQERDEAARRIVEDQSRAVAPAIFALADQVQNAVVQGPSRAALQVADVSTTEGARELSRLLRGDDAARNVNLVELQKQNQSLVKLIEEVGKVADKIGITLDLK